MINKDISSNIYLKEIDTFSNLNKINSYDKIKVNTKFNYNSLIKFLDLQIPLILIFDDYKIYITQQRLFIETVSIYDYYTINNYNNYCINENYIWVLNVLIDDYLYFLNFRYSNSMFILNKLIDTINLIGTIIDYIKCNELYNFELYTCILSKIDYIVINLKLKLENFNFNLKNSIKLIKEILRLNKSNLFFECYSGLFSLIMDKIQKIKFDDTLIQEFLKLSYNTDNFLNDLSNVNKLLQIKSKSSCILESINFNKDINVKSSEFYFSVITRTNWLEELEYGNVMGLLLNIIPKEINKNGYDLDYIPIHEITHSIIGLDQILEAYISTGNKNYSVIINGYGIGDGNCLLPLYISNDHWKLVKLYFNYNLGLIFNRNAIDTNIKFKNLYKNVLIKMINLTFSNDNYKSDKWINILYSVLRTIKEILKYDKFNLKKFKTDINFRLNCNINTILIDYLLDYNASEDIIQVIFDELIRRTLKKIYSSIDILDKLYSFDIIKALNYENLETKIDNFDLIKESKFNNWLSELERHPIFSEKITLIYGVIMMKKIILKDFFSKLDNNDGILLDKDLEFIKTKINEMKIRPENCKLNGIINSEFIKHVNYTKHQLFSSDIFIKLNLVKNKFRLYDLLIQNVIQRVDKCKKKAVKNNKSKNPFEKNDIIKSTGLLIAQRFVKKYYNLKGDYNHYIKTINEIDIALLRQFTEFMIKKTISIRKEVKANLFKIICTNKRNLVCSILNSNTIKLISTSYV